MSKRIHLKRIEKSRMAARSRRFYPMGLVTGLNVFGGLFTLWQRESLAMPGFLQTPVPNTPTPNPAFAGVEGCRATPKFFIDMGDGDGQLGYHQRPAI